MERVHGVPLSRLLVDGVFSIDLLQHVISSIVRLHVVPVPEAAVNDMDIYANYAPKMQKRFTQHDAVYHQLDAQVQVAHSIKFLEDYAAKDCGQMCVIHGDSVFTNIVLNNFGKLKFIDMRGLLGDDMTIYGDAFYDWAKVLQSLVGYDAMFLGKQPDASQVLPLLEAFKHFFVNSFDMMAWFRLEMLTKSHILSLLPLHDSAKREQFLALIKNPFLNQGLSSLVQYE